MPAPRPGNANAFIEQQLDVRIEAIESHFDSHALSFNGPLLFNVDDVIRNSIEDRLKVGPKKNKLVFIVTTTGGYIEVVQRIVETTRKHYDLVDFIIPNHAYSAGTVLAMSGDAIYMDYYSRMGPIDPQVENPDGVFVPALGYLEKYDELVKKAQDKTITTAEVQLLIKGFDQAQLYGFEQAREMSITLLKKWLVAYKFKNWTKTKTRGKTVNKAMKTNRAALIARNLNNTKKWHIHGHGISMEVLEKEIKVLIDDFGKDEELSNKIRDYHDLLDDYMSKLGTRGVVHVQGSFNPFM